MQDVLYILSMILRQTDLHFVFVNQILHKYGTSNIGVKVLGQVNTDGWWEECKHKFRGNQEKYAEWSSKIDDLVKLQSFNPIKMVPDGKGEFKVWFHPL